MTMLVTLTGHSVAQTVLFQSGFESGNPAFTGSTGTNCLINQPTALNPNTGTNSGELRSVGSNQSFSGSIITGTTIPFVAGRFYEVAVFARRGACAATSTMKIGKTATATNAAMIALTGGDQLLWPAVANITSATYTRFTARFRATVTENKFVGFQLVSGAQGGCFSSAHLDDVIITEYLEPTCDFYCRPNEGSAITSYVSDVTFNSISRASGWDGYACTGQATSVRRTLSYNLSVTALNATVSQKVVAAWIDWNRDGVFADPAERVLGTTDITTAAPPASPVTNASVTVPAGAVLGTTKMRVAMVIGTTAQTTPCNNVQLSDYEDYDITVLPAPVNMVYSSTSVTQITDTVNAGSFRNEVLRVNVFTTGQLSAPAATQMVFTTLGTTSIADITNARLYYTGSSSTFATGTQLGATVAVPPADPTAMNFAFSQTLLEGDNFFWIAYDVVPAAPAGNVIDARVVSTTVGGTSYAAASGNPAGSRPIKASFPMTYVSSTVVQNTNPLPLGSTFNDVIQVQVVTAGAISPLSVTSLTFRTNGTTNTGDIQNARVFFTGDSPVFSTATQFGATLAVPPAINTDFTVNGTATLLPGVNYFWLAYDVKPTAACNPAQIDALCNNIVVASVNRVPSPTAPLGARVINCGTAYYSQCVCDFNNPANWNTQRNGSGTALPNAAAFANVSNSFYVQNGHTMTTSAAQTVSDLYLETGSYVLANHLLTLNKLFISAFATYEQTYSQTNATIAGTYVSSFYIKKDGTWKHNNVGWLPGNSGNQYFEPYSIQWFLGVGGGTFPGGTSWGTVILDVPTAPNLIINANSLSFINGDLIIRKWGGATNFFYINMDNPIYVSGNLVISGGVSRGVSGYSCGPGGCVCNQAAIGVPVEINGDWIQSGGTWNDYYCGANASTGMAMSVGGNVEITGGTIKMDNRAGSALNLVPVQSVSHWQQSGGTVALGNTFVKSGKTINMIGSKMGDVGTGSTLTVETGAKLYASNFPVSGTGNFTLQTGAHLGIGSAAGITSAGATGNVQVGGTRLYNSGATYEYYQGLTPQITGNFITTTTNATYPSQVANLIINKNSPANIVTLTNTTDVTGTLTLTNGVLTTSATAATAPWVRIPASGTVAPVGGSANSYVDGFIRRQGATDFIFPTGNLGKWRRIAVTAPSATTEFEARYIAAQYANTTAMSVAPSIALDHVSKLEYWQLNQTGALASTKVRLYWEDASQSIIYKFDSLAVGRWSGSGWENSNCYTACPANWTASLPERTYSGIASGAGAGSIQSNTTNTFGPFTFSSIGLVSLNPLPVELLHFDGECLDGSAELRWATASEVNNEYFSVEISRDGENFIQIGTVNGAGNSNSLLNYTYRDLNPGNGVHYYRLVQNDFDGRSESSRVIAVNCAVNQTNGLSAYLSESNELVVTLDAGTGPEMNVLLIDMTGRVVKSFKSAISSGYNERRFDLTNIVTGNYVVKVIENNALHHTKVSVR